MGFRVDASSAAQLRRRGLTAAVLAVLATRCGDDERVAGDGGTLDATDAGASTGLATLEPASASSGSSAADSTGAFEPRRICDGSTDLRLVVREGGWDDGGGTGGGIVNSTLLYHQIGVSYLYVRGDCRYWVVPFQAWHRVPARTGVLDADQEQALSVELGYDRWPDVQGTYLSWSSRAGFLTFSDMAATVRCAERCGYAPLGTEEIRGWSSRTLELWSELYEQGEPVPASDPLRVDGHYEPLLRGDPMPMCFVDWPFSFEPTEAGVTPPPYPENDSWLGRSRAVTDPVIAEDIRIYWDEYAAAYEPEEVCSLEWLGGSLYFLAPDDPQSSIRMWIRDAVPFEDDDGHVPVPVPAQVFPPPSPE